ncbi:hypothetical protein [Clostridium saccharoperbutylacetonicum]|uniref:hypothetical protein n=1 Tax=Clostridium saccharoperbutylacetonicum TaxID=36745 RepID=UPI0039E86188
MNIKEFNNILNKLLKSELEFLRKRFKPYKRRSFLHREVCIFIDLKTSNDRTLGYYVNTKDFSRQRKYIHKIFITKLSLDDFRISTKLHYKSFGITKLRDTIRHELIHAFVFEEFEEHGFIDNSHCDYSPIFLGCLAWCNGHSGHAYANNFYSSYLYKGILECKKYDDVYDKLVCYILKLEKAAREINEKINRNVDDCKILKIEFNQCGAGIVKRKYLSATTVCKKDNKLCRNKLTEMTLGLGFLVTPEILFKSYERKFENGVTAKLHSELIAYVIDNKIKQKRFVLGS